MSVFKKYYYHGSIRRYIGLMTYLFQDLQVESEGSMRTVPIIYSGGEHRIPKSNVNILPMATLVFDDNNTDEQRLLNKHNNKLVTSETKQNQRVSNTFAFEYRVRCKKQDEAFQVLEQVLTAFTPSLDVSIGDNGNVAKKQNIKIQIDSWSIDDAWEGEGEEPNYYDVLFTFSLMGYLYRMDKTPIVVDEMIVNRTLEGFPEEKWFGAKKGSAS